MNFKLKKTIETHQLSGIHSVLKYYNQMITCSPLSDRIIFWSFKTGKKTKEITCTRTKICNVSALRFHRIFLLVGEYSGKMHIIDPAVKPARYLRHHRHHSAEIVRVQQMKSRKTIVISCDIFGILSVWSVISGEAYLRVCDRDEKILIFDLSCTGYLAAGINYANKRKDPLICFWPLEGAFNREEELQNETQKIENAHYNEIFSMAFSLNGDILFSGGGFYGENEVKAWDSRGKTLLFTIAEKLTAIIHMACFLSTKPVEIKSESQEPEKETAKLKLNESERAPAGNKSRLNPQSEKKGCPQRKKTGDKLQILNSSTKYQKNTKDFKKDSLKKDLPSYLQANTAKVPVQARGIKVRSMPTFLEKDLQFEEQSIVLTITFDRILSLWNIKDNGAKLKSASVSLQFHSIPYGGFFSFSKKAKNYLLLTSSNYKSSKVFIFEI